MTTTLTTACEVVCEDTSKLPREEWLALRKTGIGSSDAASALSLSPWRSQYELWAEKSGLLAEREDTQRFRIGREAEPLILGWWCEDSEYAMDEIQRHVMLRSSAYPFMLANPDGLTHDAVIEVKTDSEFDEKRWLEGVPDQYVIQALHLMAVSGRKKCIFPVSFGWNWPKEFVVTWDEATAAAMVTVEAELWRRVIEGNRPDPDGSESSMMTIRELYYAYDIGASVELTEPQFDLILEREIECETAAAHIKIADSCKQRLMEVLGESKAGVATFLGETVATWKADKNGKRAFRFSDRKKQ